MEERKMNTEFEESEGVETDYEKCEACGSNMKYDPKSNMLFCEHCGTKRAFGEGARAEELAIEDALRTETAGNWSEETKVFRCENCGAKVVLAKGETATCCPFCGTAQVVELDELAGIKPNAVLPFRLTQNDSNESCKKWAKRKWFAPNAFKKNLKPENLHGVYVPCFTFDSSTSSHYYGRIGKRHTRTVGSGKNRRTETYIVWRNISGGFNHRFDDVTITAGSKVSQKDLGKMGPFASNEALHYDGKYLLGFSAYHYEKDIVQCWGEAKNAMDAEIKRLILSQYSYDYIDYINISTTHTGVTYKYVLFPVYAGHFSFKKKEYSFFVNGTNGRVTGKTPIAVWKVLLAIVFGLAAVSALCYLVMQFM